MEKPPALQQVRFLRDIEFLFFCFEPGGVEAVFHKEVGRIIPERLRKLGYGGVFLRDQEVFGDLGGVLDQLCDDMRIWCIGGLRKDADPDILLHKGYRIDIVGGLAKEMRCEATPGEPFLNGTHPG